MARERGDDSNDTPESQRWRRRGPRAPAAGETPESEGESLDPDRLVRLRFVFAFVSVLIGSLALLLVTAILSFILAGRVDLPVAVGSFLISVGTVLLVARALLRALMARRPENDELRSLTGFVSLGTGLVLLAGVLVFLLLTTTVLLGGGGGEPVLFVLPLVALAYLTLQFLREATDDFLKRTRIGRETLLFLTSIAYFALTILVAQLLFAASVASPVALASPADGSVIPAGTPIVLEATDPNVVAITYDAGSGAQPLPSPYEINTSSWSDGGYDLQVVASAADGSSVTATFHFTVDSTPPAVSPASHANGSAVPQGDVLRFSVSDPHLARVEVSFSPNGTGVPLPSPFEINTADLTTQSHDLYVVATDAAGNQSVLHFHFTVV